MAVSNANDHAFGGAPTVGANVAVTAGGAKVLGIGTSTLGVFYGSGAPTASAAIGSLYFRTDGSSSVTRLYVNSDGATAYVAVQTL